jgi:hypothetical protein
MDIKNFFCITLFILGLTIDHASAQLNNRVAVNKSGNTLRVVNSDNQNLVGSPYLVDNWAKGNVKFFNAKPAENLDLKFDVLENILVLKGADDAENIFSEKISEFSLSIAGKERLFKTGFLDSKNQLVSAYLEVLFNGKIKFFCKNTKVIIESKEYNTPTITKKIEDGLEYYFSKDSNQISLIKLNEKSILQFLANPALAKYVSDNKLNLKNREDLIKLLQYTDSL